jgi:histidinol-phosphate aminotransferase
MTRPAPRAELMNIDAYVPGKSAASHVLGGARVYKLSANETPLGPSPRAVEAVRDLALHIADYPEGSSRLLREAIAERHGLDPARVIAGAGSDQILELLAIAYLARGDEGVYSQYGFLEYKIVIIAAGATPKIAPEDNYTANVDAILEQVTEKTRIVFLANPNNPTGTYLPATEIARLADALPPHVLLVLDAAYAEYVQAEDYEAGVALASARENVVMTRTFSKIYGLAGLRLGWGYGPKHVIEALERIRSPFNVSSPASAAGIAALRDREHIAVAVAHNAKWLPWLSQNISALGLEVLPSVGNFIAIRFPERDGLRAADADKYLTERGLILRAIGAYGMSQFLRLTIGPPEANERVVAALKDFMKGAR